MSIYGSDTTAAGNIYGGGDIYRASEGGGGIYGGGGGLYDLPQQQPPPLSPGSASSGTSTSSGGTNPTTSNVPHRQPPQPPLPPIVVGGGVRVPISEGSTTTSTTSDSPLDKDASHKPGFGEIDSLSSLDMLDEEMKMNAMEEHHSLQDVNAIRYEVGTTEATMAMVIAYTQFNRLALLGIKPSQVNANVRWSVAGGAIMYPTLTHAVLAVPNSGAKEKPDVYAKMMAHSITSMRELGADVECPDSSGVTAREYATRHNVHKIVLDALETNNTKVRKDTPYPPHDEGCWCAVQ